MKNNKAIISLHDVTPAWATEVEIGMSTVASWGVSPPSLLVVPDYHGKWPLEQFPDFTRRIKTWYRQGSEILLHGYYHLDAAPVSLLSSPLSWWAANVMTAGEGEFRSIDPRDGIDQLIRGKTKLEDIIDAPIEGFVPPAWLRNEALPQMLANLGIRFFEGHLYVYTLTPYRRRFVPVITFSGRNTLRTDASIVWASIASLLSRWTGDLRIALHPVDFRSKRLIRAIYRLIRSIRHRYEWVGYNPFLEAC